MTEPERSTIQERAYTKVSERDIFNIGDIRIFFTRDGTTILQFRHLASRRGSSPSGRRSGHFRIMERRF
jgi:hypothetical protein